MQEPRPAATESASPALILFDKARTALAEAHAVDEVKEIRDQAEALRAYYKQRDGSLEMTNQLSEIKIRAERRLGELLAETTIKGGERHKSADSIYERRPTLPIGISADQSSDWQRMARLPESDFEAHIATTREEQKPLTTAGVLRQAKHKQENGRPAKSKQPSDMPWDMSKQRGNVVANAAQRRFSDGLAHLSGVCKGLEETNFGMVAAGAGIEELKAWDKQLNATVYAFQKIHQRLSKQIQLKDHETDE